MTYQVQSSNGKEEIPDAAKLRAHPLADLDRLDRLFEGKHISTDDGYYPGSGVDQNTESETVTENEHDIVNLEDDPDVSSRNQNEIPSSFNQNSKRVYRNTSRSSSSARKRGTTKASYDFLERAIASLQTLSGLQYDSLLYWGAVNVLQSNETHARVYFTLPDDDARIKYLERMTGIDREAE
ncbi:hypothetical protein N665_0383s0129 [Sinapis alba]|nr:hypothetical protein N665_0383s0129 [Sinapis alba]